MRPISSAVTHVYGTKSSKYFIASSPSRKKSFLDDMLVTNSHHRNKSSGSALLMSTAASSNNSGENHSSTHIESYESKVKLLDKSSKLSLAPMMEYTDRHFRHLVRLLSSNTLVYTEMIAANAISYEYNALQRGDIEDDWMIRRFTSQSTRSTQSIGGGREGPSVLQLGGSDPEQLATAAQCIEELTKEGFCDYTALNLNCGCPSEKVAGKGCFGAAMMRDPTLVKNCVEALSVGCHQTMPVTVKCRIGTDDIPDWKTNDSELYSQLQKFIETVASSGKVTDFQLHARIAILGRSISPAQNRKIPPLRYDLVRRLVEEYPELTFSLNGGIDSLDMAIQELDHCPDLAGVMVGRSFAAQPWNWACADSLLYNNDGNEIFTLPQNRWELLVEYGKHADAEEKLWTPKIRRQILKALMGLFAGEPNGKKFRIALEEMGGIPKKYEKFGLSMENEPPLSELILNAAQLHLKDDILYRSPRESYDMGKEVERMRHVKKQEAAAACLGGNDNIDASKSNDDVLVTQERSQAVIEWQELRNEERKQKQTRNTIHSDEETEKEDIEQEHTSTIDAAPSISVISSS